MTSILWYDSETYSETPIKHGTYRYAEDAEIMIITYAIDDGPVRAVDLTADVAWPTELRHALGNDDVLIYAHNSMFDRAVLSRHGVLTRRERWRDTMVQALAHSMPGALDVLCELLGVPLDKAKHKTGKDLVQLFCKPRPKHIDLRRATQDTHPEQWAQFLEYACADVDAMREVHNRLPQWNYGDRTDYGRLEIANWHLDQEINDRGIEIDTDLVDKAVVLIAEEQRRLATETYIATNGEVDRASKRDAMLQHIFEEYGVALPDLRSSTIDRRLEDPDLPQGLKELLALRQMTSTTSTSKYQALARAVNDDGRLRGTLQYNGASRTGRWAGRVFQPQNLPSRGLLPLAKIREGIDAIKGGYVNAMGDDYFGHTMLLTASSIRGCLTAPTGSRFCIADLANIEGRMLAWEAGEEWKLKAFADYDTGIGHDLYKMAYSKAFCIEPESVTKFGRQIGKVMELACFSAETKVLTNNGVKAIAAVLVTDLLWDGEEWTRHEGVVEKGVRPVVHVDGISLTPEHLVLTGGTWRQARQLASSESLLSQALATGSANLPLSRQSSARPGGALGCSSSARAGGRSTSWRYLTCEKGQAPGAIGALRSRLQNGVKTITGTRTSFLTSATGGGFLIGYPRALTDATIRMTRVIRTMAGEASTCLSRGARTAARTLRTLSPYPGGMLQSLNSTGKTSIKGMNPETCASSRNRKTKGIDEKYAKCKTELPNLRPVYDIVNAGPRNRFTIVSDSGHLIVHNCGYAGGVGAFMTFALAYGIDLEDMAETAWDTLPDDLKREALDFYDWLIDKKNGRDFGLSREAYVTCEVFKRAWRYGHPNVTALWEGVQSICVKAVEHPGETFAYGRFRARKSGVWLRLLGPSGRSLCYPNAHVERDGKRANLSYMGVHQYTRKWCRLHTHGGKLVENITQMLACEALKANMPAAEAEGYKLVLSVHDELITEAPDTDDYTGDGLAAIMSRVPSWADGLPLAAAGFHDYRYRKDE